MATAFRLVRGAVGGVVLAGGTFAGLCYYSIWNADRHVEEINNELVNLNKAKSQAALNIKTNLEELAVVEKQKESMMKKIDGTKKVLAKAEEQVARLKDEISDYNKQLEEKKQKIASHNAQKSVLRRILTDRNEDVTVAEQALFAAQKQALHTRAEMDPIKRLQIDKWLN